MRFDEMVVWRSKNGLSMLLAAVSSVALGALIVKVPASHFTFLLLGLLAVALLGTRPDWFVVAFWTLVVLLGTFTEQITHIEASVGGLVINPFGLLNGLLPLFYVTTYVLRGTKPAKVPVRGILLALAAWATLSLALSGFKPQGIRQWVTILNWISAYLLFVEGAWRKADHTKTALYFAVVVILSAISVIWSGLLGQGIADYSHQMAYGAEVINRASGIGTDQPEGAGETLSLFAVACLALLVGQAPRRKALIAIYALLGAGIWFTHARTATFGLLAGSLVVLWRGRRLSWISGGLALTGAVFLIVTNPRFDWSATLTGNVNPIVYANAIWRLDTSAGLLRELSPLNMFWGKGIGSTMEELGGASPHNEYVVYLHDMGIVGMGLFLAISVAAFRYASTIYAQAQQARTRDWALACVGLVVADAVIKLGDLWPTSASYSFWLIVGMLFVSVRSEQAATSQALDLEVAVRAPARLLAEIPPAG